MSEEQDVYRKVYPRMFGDARIMALSRPPPNGLTVWFHLLFGEHTGIVPGLFKVGEAAFAESLGWPLHGGETLLESFPKTLPRSFREAFAEVEAQGLVKADWKARLVYVKNALRVHPPASPNVVIRWGKHWRSLPECDLKNEAEQDFRSFLKTIGESFAEAFDKASGKPSPNQDPGSRIQDPGSRGGRKRAGAPPPAPPSEPETMLEVQATRVPVEQAVELFEHWQSEHHRVHKSAKVLVAPSAGLESARQVLTLAAGDRQLAKQVVTRFVEGNQPYWRDKKWALWVLANPKDFEQARLTIGLRDDGGLPF